MIKLLQNNKENEKRIAIYYIYYVYFIVPSPFLPGSSVTVGGDMARDRREAPPPDEPGKGEGNELRHHIMNDLGTHL